MRFAEKVRELRKAKNLSQRALAGLVGVDATYLSKVENERLNFADYPSEELIRKLAGALGADENELLVLAEKVPPAVRKRVLERPDAFCILAGLDDDTLDGLVAQVRPGFGRKPSRANG